MHTSIAIKSFLIIDGKKCLDDIFDIDVYIIANEVEFVQIELSTNPDFTNKSIYLNINKVDYSENLSNKDLLSYLTCQRVEENLNISNENAVYNVFITEKTPEIYMKFRLVYTNGTIKNLDKSNLGELYNLSIDNKTFDANSNYLYLTDDKLNYLECEPMGEYFVLKLNKNYLSTLYANSSVFKFDFLGDLQNLNLNANNNLKKFNFAYLDLNNKQDVKKLYVENEDGTYTYSYWDERTIPEKVEYENGKVIGFLG